MHGDVSHRPEEILMRTQRAGEVENAFLAGQFLLRAAHHHRPFTKHPQDAVERRQRRLVVLQQVRVAQVDPARRHSRLDSRGKV